MIMDNSVMQILDIVDVDEKDRIVSEKLVQEISFMSEVLDELKELIKTRGVGEINKEGNFCESSFVKLYNSTAKVYAGMLKQLEFIGRKNQQLSAGEKLLKAWQKR